jgi:hypothetical protein
MPRSYWSARLGASTNHVLPLLSCCYVDLAIILSVVLATAAVAAVVIIAAAIYR